jgi:hypothetical protein
MSAPSGPAGWSRRPAQLILPILLFALLAVGCSPLVRAEQPSQPERVLLTPGETVGQTFVTRYAGLAGIDLYLRPEEPGDGQLLLRLSRSPQSGEALASASLPLDAIGSPGYYRFQLTPQPGPAGQDYFASLELHGDGTVWAGIAPGGAYLNGAQYKDQAPQEGQLAFRLVYDPGHAAWGLFGEGLGWLGGLAAAALLFAIPGWAALSRLLPDWHQLSWGEKLGLATGTSLSIYPLLFLWTHLSGLQLGPVSAWGPALVGVGLLVEPLFRAGPPRPYRLGKSIRRIAARLKRVAPADLATLALAALVFATRFWAIRSLDVPLWGDSYQHTLITQLLVEHGGLFRSWAPYAELQTFTYHFGFHTLVAVFHWITRMPAPQAVLWTGQILNGLAVLALYPLAVRFGRSRWAGAAAVLAAGLLAQMPMSYVNWGRYTELAGLAILPAAVYLVDRLLSAAPEELVPAGVVPSPIRSKEERAPEKGKSNPGRVENRWIRFARSDLFKNLLLAWVVLGGLALTHYRVLVFAGLFLPAALLLFDLSLRMNDEAHKMRPTFSLQPGGARLAVLKTLAAGMGAALLFLPWFVRIFSGRILQVFGGLVTTPPGQVAESVAQYNAIGDLGSYLPLAMWILALLSLVWGIWRRERGAALIGLWWLLILLAANPHWLGLPGLGALSNFAVFIAAYLPAGILLGAATGWAWEGIGGYGWMSAPARRNGRVPGVGGKRRKASPKQPKSRLPGTKAIPATRSNSRARLQTTLAWATLLLFLVSGLWGARARLRDVAIAQHALVTRPDLRAAAWILANTPQTARFLVNSFLAYGDTLVAGSDAGWWLPLIARRATILPPINYSSEQGPRADYLDWTNAVTIALQERGLDDPQMLEMLKERGVTHVYVGQRQGQVGNPAPALLQPGPLSESPYFRVVYHQDRVWIFEMLE